MQAELVSKGHPKERAIVIGGLTVVNDVEVSNRGGAVRLHWIYTDVHGVEKGVELGKEVGS
jgi:hypothetical protein